MVGYQFYLDRTSVRGWERVVQLGNCVAVRVDEESKRVLNPSGYVEAVLPMYRHPNSVVYSGKVSGHVLDTHCSPIPEEEARRIHPRLFAYLEGGRA